MDRGMIGLFEQRLDRRRVGVVMRRIRELERACKRRCERGQRFPVGSTEPAIVGGNACSCDRTGNVTETEAEMELPFRRKLGALRLRG